MAASSSPAAAVFGEEPSPSPRASASAGYVGGVNGSARDDWLYLVPYRWFEPVALKPRDGVPCLVAVAAEPSSLGAKIMGIFFPEKVFHLMRADGVMDRSGNGMNGSGGARWLALVSKNDWLRACKRHHDASEPATDGKEKLAVDDGSVDLFPLILRIYALTKTNSLAVKICQKDNVADSCQRALKLLNSNLGPVYILDFSQEISEQSSLSLQNYSSDQEVVLNVHVSDMVEALSGATIKDDSVRQGDLVMANGSNKRTDISMTSESYKQRGTGLLGLENLGNTCYMNSALQCLAHTTKLVDYFLGGLYIEYNLYNPLGMQGQLARAFGDLLGKLWSLDKAPVAPRQFKSKLAQFAPQFAGYRQHDSQELLAFLLAGLHEDLNRGKSNYTLCIEIKDSEGRTDEKVADEYWENHLARNNSIIVDICHGQYKSTLVCPMCSKVSVTFDPFVCLSLPLPYMMRSFTVTVFGIDGSIRPSPYTVNIPKGSDIQRLVEALNNACALRDDERLLIAQVSNNRIIRYFEESSSDISSIREADHLVAYRLPKDCEKKHFVVFTHQISEEVHLFGRVSIRWKTHGIPLLASVSGPLTAANIYSQFCNILKPFHIGQKQEMDDDGNMLEVACADEVAHQEVTDVDNAVQFYVSDEKFSSKLSRIEMDKPVTCINSKNRVHVLVEWQGRAFEQYDLPTALSSPEVCKSSSPAKKSESCSLYACLDSFVEEEPLGADNKWLCPRCEQQRQANKKLDLWRLPEVLIIHLKRFSHSRFRNQKLETMVDFPIHDLDMSKYLCKGSKESTSHYRLYAVSNHYGNMGGGHYTAAVYEEGQKQWFEFDDRRVSRIPESAIKSSAAYVLFYRKEEKDQQSI